MHLALVCLVLFDVLWQLNSIYMNNGDEYLFIAAMKQDIPCSVGDELQKLQKMPYIEIHRKMGIKK